MAGDKLSLSVAVIGAGTAGTAAAKELLKEGHRVTIFEQKSTVGGLWVYNPNTGPDPTGQDESAYHVQSSVYKDLRANLPRELMAYSDFPFAELEWRGLSTDPRRFPGHVELAEYMRQYYAATGLASIVKLNTKVLDATPLWEEGVCPTEGSARGGSWPRWQLTTAPSSSTVDGEVVGPAEVATFDALVVANGHANDTSLPALEGAAAFPGLLLHSHNYRERAGFAGKRVVCIGNAVSGGDVATEIADVAEVVFLAGRTWAEGKGPEHQGVLGARENVLPRFRVESLGVDGSVVFEGGAKEERIDAVVFCTGYQYRFRFLDNAKVVSVVDKRIHTLFLQTFVPACPSLSFVGLMAKTMVFVEFELQGKWVAKVLSGRASLPSKAIMEDQAESFYKYMIKIGRPVHLTHDHDSPAAMLEHMDRIVAVGQLPPVTEWRRKLYVATMELRASIPMCTEWREDWQSCQSFVEAVAEAAEDIEALRGKKSEAAVASALANLKAAEL